MISTNNFKILRTSFRSYVFFKPRLSILKSVSESALESMKQKTYSRVILIMSERLRVERILNAFETKDSRDTVKCEELTQDQDIDSALK